MACSIKRKAGARVEALSCVGNDDRPPEPQEVVKGKHIKILSSAAEAHGILAWCCWHGSQHCGRPNSSSADSIWPMPFVCQSV